MLIGDFMECYICDQQASKICKTCGSVTCDKHFKLIHEKCKIGNRSKIARLDFI